MSAVCAVMDTWAMSLFNRAHPPRPLHAQVSDMANQHDTLEEREARLEIRIKEYQAAERRRLISHGIALGTRAEIEHTMARDAKPPSRKIN